MGMLTSQSCDGFEISKAPITVLHRFKLTTELVPSPRMVVDTPDDQKPIGFLIAPFLLLPDHPTPVPQVSSQIAHTQNILTT